MRFLLFFLWMGFTVSNEGLDTTHLEGYDHLSYALTMIMADYPNFQTPIFEYWESHLKKTTINDGIWMNIGNSRFGLVDYVGNLW